jgi:hypothetical protein
MILSVDGTDANHWIDPTMLRQILDHADHAHHFDRATSSMPERIAFYGGTGRARIERALNVVGLLTEKATDGGSVR